MEHIKHYQKIKIKEGTLSLAHKFQTQTFTLTYRHYFAAGAHTAIGPDWYRPSAEQNLNLGQVRNLSLLIFGHYSYSTA